MEFTETRLKGSYLVSPLRRGDDRGFFERHWCSREFSSLGLATDMVQANFAFSVNPRTLRGLHYQKAPNAEAKLVRCLAGAIYDVIVDLRPESSTYKQWLGIELTAQDHSMLYVPEGFAHGYMTLERNVEVFYLVSRFYTPEAEKGIRWNDPAFAITWPTTEQPVISAKDSHWPDFLETSHRLGQYP